MCDDNESRGLHAMTFTDDTRERRVGIALVGLFCAIAALAAWDLITDLREGTTAVHAIVEGVLVAAAVAGAGWMATRVRALAQDAQELRARLDASRDEAAHWRLEAQDLITGLSAAIERQFERWRLTTAEREIALLLLKGLSHKEVAAVRGVGENTVRQQARAIYRKAGLTGRHDLAAFFLEDLLSAPA
jgi:DNA-binding CsgD family transcriptional regulator